MEEVFSSSTDYHMIGVILPSRGLMFAEAVDQLNRNLEGYSFRIYISHDLPIPECENVLAAKALFDNCESLLFIEDDTCIPDRGLHALITLDSDIACIDYGVAGWGCVTRSTSENEVLWCGLGCTLVKRRVFEAMEAPYFRSDKVLLVNDWPRITWIPAGKQQYGGQDIYFCVTARSLGFKIKQVEGMECRHLKLDSLGTPERNHGLHSISQKDTINKKQTL